MKKLFVLSALIAGIALGQSEPRVVGSPQEKDVPPPVVQGFQKPPSVAKKQTRSPYFSNSKRDQSGRRRMEEDELSVSERESTHVTHVQTPTTPLESEYLREIALVFSIPVSKDDTPGDIAFKIKQYIGSTERYRGEVLSDESFEKAKSSIRIPADAETFRAYHIFIKKVVGKRIIIVGDN